MSVEGRIHFVTFAGVIGVGKSTVLHHLESSAMLQAKLDEHCTEAALAPQVVFVKEPSELWDANGWLQAFYQDPSLNAAAFQFLAFTTHTDAVAAAIADARIKYGKERDLLLVAERGMYDQRLFWEVQRDNKEATASPIYNDAYVRIWEKWRKFEPEPDLICHLYTSNLDTVMKRVTERARGAESSLSRAYQVQLLEKHNEWFTAPQAHPLGGQGVACEMICTDSPPHTINDVCQQVVSAVISRVYTQQNE